MYVFQYKTHKFIDFMEFSYLFSGIYIIYLKYYFAERSAITVLSKVKEGLE